VAKKEFTGVAHDFKFNKETRKYSIVELKYNDSGECKVTNETDLGGTLAIAVFHAKKLVVEKIMKLLR